MREQFVTCNIALALKEKGFNQPCFGGVDSKGEWFYHPDSDIVLDFPIWQQVIDWIWDTYGFNIYTQFGFGWEYAISDSTNIICGDGTFNTRNEAIKEAILKVFELLKETK